MLYVLHESPGEGSVEVATVVEGLAEGSAEVAPVSESPTEGSVGLSYKDR
jgi:hypothetical protein